jgi:hypothetical protein
VSSLKDDPTTAPFKARVAQMHKHYTNTNDSVRYAARAVANAATSEMTDDEIIVAVGVEMGRPLSEPIHNRVAVRAFREHRKDYKEGRVR